MKQEAAALLSVEGLEAASQAGSEFSAVFDLNDGCIHFKKGAPTHAAAATAPASTSTPTPAAAVPSTTTALVVYSLDTMTLKDAAVVAEAHLIARGAEERRAELTREREAAWTLALRIRAAAKVYHAWTCWRLRRLFLDGIRMRTETIIDGETGVPYYLDTDTHMTYHSKLLLFRGEDVHTPAEWYVKRAGQGSSVAEAGGAPYYYQHARQPWKHSATPPEGYSMCAVCGIDFATRRCLGSGCDGCVYCFACFVTYHPRGVGSGPGQTRPAAGGPAAGDAAAAAAATTGKPPGAGAPRRRASIASAAAAPAFAQHWLQFTRVAVVHCDPGGTAGGGGNMRIKAAQQAAQRTRRQSLIMWEGEKGGGGGGRSASNKGFS